MFVRLYLLGCVVICVFLLIYVGIYNIKDEIVLLNVIVIGDFSVWCIFVCVGGWLVFVGRMLGWLGVWLVVVGNICIIGC